MKQPENTTTMTTSTTPSSTTPPPPKAYINALAEEGTREDLIKWVKILDHENGQLTRDNLKLRRQIEGLRKENKDFDEELEYWVGAQRRR